MKKHAYVALFLSLLIVFANQQAVNAQSAGGASKVEPGVTQPVKSRAEIIRKEAARMREQIDVSQEQREELVSKLYKKSVSDISFESVFRMLHVQKVELAIELEGLKARQDLLKEKVSSSATESGSAVKMQRELLERYVANQAENVGRVNKLFRKGAMSSADVQKSEQLLAEAEIRLNEFMIKSKQASPSLVEAMFEVSLEIAEKNAKQSTVEKMLKTYIESLDDLDRLKEMDNAIESQSEHYRKLNKELWSLRNS